MIQRSRPVPKLEGWLGSKLPSVVELSTSKLLTSIWTRIALSASQGTKARFISTFDMFFRALAQQAVERKDGVVSDLETYITQRRDTSGCRPCWVLIEYANGLDLPESVMEHKEMRIMNDATNDLVSWSNVSS